MNRENMTNFIESERLVRFPHTAENLNALETKDLVIDKARFEDWPDIYRNVWSRPDCARYMLWSVTANEEDAMARMQRTLKWQAEHEAWFIYEKKSGRAIGFTGVGPVFDGPAPEGAGNQASGNADATQQTTVWEECGLCIGTEFQRRGYGRQTAEALMAYAREKHGAAEFQVSIREANEASRKLAESQGLTLHHTEQRIDERDGSTYTMLIFRKPL